MSKRIFTDKILQFLRANCKGRTSKKLADVCNEHFGTNFTLEQMQRCKSTYRLVSGVVTRFKKGDVPVNKGKHYSEELKAKIRATGTMFEKGHRPCNYVPVGTERLIKDGYFEVKINDEIKYRTASGKKNEALNERWIPKAQKVWIDHYGDIPPHHRVIFLDNDRTNFDIENLACIPSGVHAIMNHNRRYSKDKDTTQAFINITKLEQAITNKKRRK